MKIQKLVKILKEHRPKTAEEMLQLGIELKLLDTGCYRAVYTILNTPAVVKFPLGEDGRLRFERHHTRKEIEGFKRAARSKRLRKHLPVIYYSDAKAGVIVMRWYRTYPTERTRNAKSERLENLCLKFFRRDADESDYEYTNFGYTPGGWIKILDLGIC